MWLLPCPSFHSWNFNHLTHSPTFIQRKEVSLIFFFLHASSELWPATWIIQILVSWLLGPKLPSFPMFSCCQTGFPSCKVMFLSYSKSSLLKYKWETFKGFHNPAPLFLLNFFYTVFLSELFDGVMLISPRPGSRSPSPDLIPRSFA